MVQLVRTGDPAYRHWRLDGASCREPETTDDGACVRSDRVAWPVLVRDAGERAGHAGVSAVGAAIGTDAAGTEAERPAAAPGRHAQRTRSATGARTRNGQRPRHRKLRATHRR